MEEEEQDVICIDDVTSKEMPCHAVRKALEQELMYLRHLGVYERGKTLHVQRNVAGKEAWPPKCGRFRRFSWCYFLTCCLLVVIVTVGIATRQRV